MPHLDAEPALTAAIRATPDDTAPWLAYADWLRENGRDAVADCVARHLPALQAEVRRGRGVTDAIAGRLAPEPHRHQRFLPTALPIAEFAPRGCRARQALGRVGEAFRMWGRDSGRRLFRPAGGRAGSNPDCRRV